MGLPAQPDPPHDDCCCCSCFVAVIVVDVVVVADIIVLVVALVQTVPETAPTFHLKYLLATSFTRAPPQHATPPRPCSRQIELNGERCTGDIICSGLYYSRKIRYVS